MFSIPKGFFHDKTVLILLSSILLIFMLSIVLIFLNFSSDGSYLVRYRSQLLDIEGRDTIGGIGSFYSFVAVFVLSTTIGLLLSMRMFLENRNYSVAILSLTLFVLAIGGITANALLRSFP